MSEVKFVSLIRKVLRQTIDFENHAPNPEQRAIYHSLRFGLETFLKYAPQPVSHAPKTPQKKDWSEIPFNT